MFHKKNSMTTERYTLDGMPLEFNDVCGRPAVSRGWRIRTTDIQDQFLRRGWANDFSSHSAIYTRAEGYVQGDLGRRWVEEQVCLMGISFSGDCAQLISRRRWVSKISGAIGDLSATSSSRRRGVKSSRLGWCTITVKVSTLRKPSVSATITMTCSTRCNFIVRVDLSNVFQGCMNRPGCIYTGMKSYHPLSPAVVPVSVVMGSG